MALTIRLTVAALVAYLVMLPALAPAWAYVGPGAGLGLLAAFGALLAAVVGAIGFLVLWPLRLRRARRARARGGPPDPGATPTASRATDDRRAG